MFVDQVRVEVRGGDGGRGAVSFRREKFVPRGGPDGGDGGDGGNVIFYCEPGETTLIDLHGRPWYAAGKGGHGGSNRRTGATGEDCRLPVPPGTVVFDADNDRQIGEVVQPGDELVVAAGGRGGKGNACFATSTNQLPNTAQPGTPGEVLNLLVELKMVADIGLVGFPNAGKSTLINALTQARAKIGAYPFTTLNPVLGTLELTAEDEQALTEAEAQQTSLDPDQRPRIILADIPGIIAGAHEGVGLGLDFLRHIARTKMLLFVLDCGDHPETDPPEAYRWLLSELVSYDPELVSRPRIIALNKVDQPPFETELAALFKTEFEAADKEFSPRERLTPVYEISALNATGTEELRAALVAEMLDYRQQLRLDL